MNDGLRIDVVDPGTELTLVGRLDTRSAPFARASLQEAVDASGGDLVLHVERLEIWDAGGLGVLVGVYRRGRQRGRRLVLTGVQTREARLFRRTRLDRLIEVKQMRLAG